MPLPGSIAVSSADWLTLSGAQAANWTPASQTTPTSNQPPGRQPTPDLSEYINSIYSKKTVKKSRQKIYNEPLIEAFSGKLGNNYQEGEIGLEIECEGTNLFDKPIKYWKCVADGSLRASGDSPPVEYVLRKPIPRKEVPEALSYLVGKLKQAGSRIDDSTRTSVHVHVNCQRLTIKEIYQYWCLYTIFEELLVDFSGPDRVGNLFCLRSKDAENAVQILESSIQNESFNDMFSDNLRYTSCNTASLGKFGSLEFRSMRGTVDQELIQTWVDILLILRDKAVEYGDPQEIVLDFEKIGPEAFLKKVFTRDDLLRIFSNRPDRNTVLWDGLRLMRDVAFAVKWEKRDLSIKKEIEASMSPGITWSPDGMTYSYPVPERGPGYYWTVNVSGHGHEIPKASGSGRWVFGSTTKLLFNSEHVYVTERASTVAERSVSQHHQPQSEPTTTRNYPQVGLGDWYLVDAHGFGENYYWVVNVSPTPKIVRNRGGLLREIPELCKALYRGDHSFVNTTGLYPEDY